jgi:hypothetical protein
MLAMSLTHQPPAGLISLYHFRTFARFHLHGRLPDSQYLNTAAAVLGTGIWSGGTANTVPPFR